MVRHFAEWLNPKVHPHMCARVCSEIQAQQEGYVDLISIAYSNGAMDAWLPGFVDNLMQTASHDGRTLDDVIKTFIVRVVLGASHYRSGVSFIICPKQYIVSALHLVFEDELEEMPLYIESNIGPFARWRLEIGK